MPRGRPSREAIYRLLAETKDDLNRLGGLPRPLEADAIWSELWHQEAHHSTALEGNTLIPSEVQKLLDEGRAVGSKELREYMEVVGYANAAQWVYGQGLEPGDWTTGNLISIHEIRNVHYEAMDPVWQVAPHPQARQNESPGNWRQHNIQPFAEGMKPPDFPLVDALMQQWVDDVNHLRDGVTMALPEELARIHNRFEQIHPFLDGNGRTGRLLLNLVLLRLGFAPAIIFKNQRTKYLKAMHRADVGDFGPLGELIARAVTNNMVRFVVPAVAGPERLVPLASLADESHGPTQNALRAAIDRGRLRARKSPTGRWLSSRIWVEEYLASRYKPPH